MFRQKFSINFIVVVTSGHERDNDTQNNRNQKSNDGNKEVTQMKDFVDSSARTKEKMSDVKHLEKMFFSKPSQLTQVHTPREGCS